jgi:HEAT repeat protein
MKRILLAMVIASGVLGCTEQKQPQKIVPPPKSGPKVPVAHNVPVSPELRGKAKVELTAAVQSSDAVLRANAIEAMQRSLGLDARKEIVQSLSDHDSVVRFSAAMACGVLKLEEARPILLQMVSDPDRSCQVAAIFALHRMGDKRFSHELEKTAHDFSPAVRSNTCLALGLLGEPSGVKILRTMQNDTEANVRLQAAEAMWRLGSEDGLNVLVAGTVSAHPDDRIICILALAGPRDQRVIEHIRGQLVNDYVEVSLAAARALGELGSDEGFPIALQYASSNDPRQRVLAAFALGDIRRTDCQGTLSTLLTDRVPSVRLAAATAVLQLPKP